MGSIYDISIQDIDGNEVSLSQYRGQVMMIVNVASKCGFTGQYADLEALYEKYKGQGFVILGFPSNDFLWQEPGSNAEIKQFCMINYGVTFPMFAKISVKGRDKHPLYDYLTDDKTNPRHAGKITWNFNKFLVGRNGTIVARFDSRTKPLNAEVIKEIEAALSIPPKTDG
ncbi:MAG TPA: glutathione peroxidase [Candidatus Brocadiia bacterium]|nr:glutathione peroxidase [Candidatus Brocadiia bacterium]